MNTEGPIRGLIARWLMRFEAAGGILQIGFLGVTAASTLVTALSLLGLESYAPAVLVAGLVGVVVYAWAYVELGIYNRKNRERQDRGNNFAKPQNRIDDELIARGTAAGLKGETLSATEREAIDEELDDAYRRYRGGIDIER